ncbi:hypothetical protein AAHC03_010149 [Spirometra sp. Aus1]
MEGCVSALSLSLSPSHRAVNINADLTLARDVAGALSHPTVRSSCTFQLDRHHVILSRRIPLSLSPAAVTLFSKSLAAIADLTAQCRLTSAAPWPQPCERLHPGLACLQQTACQRANYCSD